MIRRLRALRRALLIVGWTAGACLVQRVLIALPGRPKVAFARLYWAVTTRLLGMQVRVLGTPAGGQPGGRPVIYVSNHSSWLDVPVLGGNLSACFVSKDDVARWPVIGLVARLGRTIFVSRQRVATGRERDDMRQRLAAGDDLILFPEGTSSDGSRVLPFHSAFFALAMPDAAPSHRDPLVQPVSVVFDRLGGLPVGSVSRAVFSWYGDMDLFPHIWQLVQWRSMRASVILHPPLDPASFASRKALAQAAGVAVAAGAAALRQNRPFEPVAASGAVPRFPLDKAAPAFA